jgi:uncharacterized membrane protein YkvI
MKYTFTPQDSEKLTGDQKQSTLKSLMFLEGKNVTIKGRMCADRRKKREGSMKSDVILSTVVLELVLVTSTIDAFERRDVVSVDVPIYFMTANMDEEVTMCLRGCISELMVKTAPNVYHKYISLNNKCDSILYVKLQKAL